MRCKTCDYQLWNLTEKRCPECGAPFRPSDFDLVPSSVQFLCPHCRQAYYGTGPRGHLVPVEFDCASCGQHVHMDDMLLLPAPGHEDVQTRVNRLPWLERGELGYVKAWIGTVKLALVGQYQLMRALPLTSPTGSAWLFAFVTLLLTTFVGMVMGAGFMLALSAIPAFTGAGPTPLGLFRMMIVQQLTTTGLTIVGTLLFMALWGLVTHVMLRLTGGAAHGLSRTMQAILYGYGAHAVSVVPCVGASAGIWWLVSSILMVKEGQKVHGGRATLAVLTPPGVALLLVVAIGFVAVIGMFSGWTGGPFAGFAGMGADVKTQAVLDAVTTYAEDHSGTGPTHAVQLLTGDYLAGADLIGSETATSEEDVTLAGTTLDEFELLPAAKQLTLQQKLLQQMPKSVAAHRLGDFVFVHHGIDLSNCDGQLWIVISSPDPATNSAFMAGLGPAQMAVGLADGKVTTFPMMSLPSQLAQQNKLRAVHNLPPLPDPATVKHAQPAAAATPPASQPAQR